MQNQKSSVVYDLPLPTIYICVFLMRHVHFHGLNALQV